MKAGRDILLTNQRPMFVLEGHDVIGWLMIWPLIGWNTS